MIRTVTTPSHHPVPSDLLKRLVRPGPRYTSYPTAADWRPLGPARYEDALRSSDGMVPQSLYVHIPFCESLCTFCGCTMNIRRRGSSTVDLFLARVAVEWERVASLLGRAPLIRQLHWGGGSPSFLDPLRMQRLMDGLWKTMDLDADAEIAVELDPRRLTREQLKTLRRLGFNRVSLGVQDFDPVVMDALNRRQPYERVVEVTDWIRAEGFSSLNFDLIYGLPHQTLSSLAHTIDRVVRLKPDRIAFYSFAYVPHLKKHQRKIDPTALPDPETKLQMFLLGRDRLLQAGYQAIAMDHFALPGDELAEAYRRKRLYRNFMGYTVLPDPFYLGIGPSAISHLPAGYFQNAKELPRYFDAIDHDGLATRRGCLLNDDDRRRQWVIHELMCHAGVDKATFEECFGDDFDEYFRNEQDHIERCEKAGLLTVSEDALRLTEWGRLFVRNVCMGFDRYRHPSTQSFQFSQTV